MGRKRTSISTTLIVGCGYVGSAFAALRHAEGRRIAGIRRRLPDPDGFIKWSTADVTDRRSLRSLDFEDIDEVVYAVSADAHDEESYRAAYVEGPINVLAALHEAEHLPKRFVFLSSTGVYAQSDGEEVDETSPTEPKTFSGRLLLAGEEAVLADGIRSTVLRLGGLYGPGRRRIVKSVKDGRTISGLRTAFTNRIHRDDAAAAVAHVLDLDEPDLLYNVVDREPAQLGEVLAWIAAATARPIPPGSTTSQPTRSNKRVSSARLSASGFAFRFPTYREGYRSLID